MCSRDSATPQPPIGIDLGTTYSAIAYLDASGRPITIANDAGDLLTPSAVAFDRDIVLVGKEAVKTAVFEPAVFADCFKRDMGRREFHRPIAGTQVPPEVLSAFILRQLKQEAENRLDCEIREAVITVPAFFDETRRRATQEAGRLAGLNVLDLINEPTAAAIAFGYQRTAVLGATAASQRERVLVYDLGGGTFDVTVLEIDGQSFRALATDGDVQLGGRDFDERLMDYVAQQFQAAHRVDPRADPQDAAQLWHNVQEAKHALTQRTTVAVPCVHHGTRMRVDISRAEFERMTADLLDRTETTTQLVLRAASLEWSDIDRVLLVGGSTRMPAVNEMLKRATGKEPDRSLSPDEAVAHGAALYAGLLSGKSEAHQPSGFSLVNVNSHSLGIIGIDQRAKCNRNIVLIPRNTPLPARAVRKFATARANQSSVKVVVVEGESERPEHCIRLGECVVRNLPPALPKGTRIDVEYSYSTNGRLSVRARVPAARQSAAVEIQYDQALHIPDLDTWHERVLGLADSVSQGESLDLMGLDDEVEGLVNRLEDLHRSFGEKALLLQLPSPFQGDQNAARIASKDLNGAMARYVDCEKKRQAAVGQAEVLAANAALAKASVEVEHAEAKLRTALHALGQKCILAEFAPEPLAGLYAEIKRLQSV
jgi:molecular chaperone DnaK